jgi:hypothetical protein
VLVVRSRPAAPPRVRWRSRAASARWRSRAGGARWRSRGSHDDTRVSHLRFDLTTIVAPLLELWWAGEPEDRCGSVRAWGGLELGLGGY